jgi:hypothetical protein
MVGSISAPVSVGSLVTIPPSILASNFFFYTSGYMIADSIIPGRGYWIKASQAGKLVMDASAPAAAAAGVVPSPTRLLDGLHRLSVEGGSGMRQTLFFGPQGDIPVPSLEMPQTAPPGGFDARFSLNLLAEFHPRMIENPVDFPIIIRSDEREIKFSWDVENEEKFIYILKEKAGNTAIAETRLSGTGDLLVQFHKQSSYSLYVQQAIGTSQSPARYALGELYPNPFNPSARVPFSLPVDAHVTIKVYSVLGQEVQTLLDGAMSAGEHETRWDVGPNGAAASGVYYVRMEARGLAATAGRVAFVGVQKIILLK